MSNFATCLFQQHLSGDISYASFRHSSRVFYVVALAWHGRMVASFLFALLLYSFEVCRVENKTAFGMLAVYFNSQFRKSKYFPVSSVLVDFKNIQVITFCMMIIL